METSVQRSAFAGHLEICLNILLLVEFQDPVTSHLKLMREQNKL